MLYLTLKALHLIAGICWFAALFYLPRLFVYHVNSTDTLSHERFILMERRLYNGIMRPAMLATLILGACLIYLQPAWLKMGWLHAKLTLVFLLIGYHHVCAAKMRAFAQQRNRHSAKFYRWFNEIPTVLLIVIVLLAVIKPF